MIMARDISLSSLVPACGFIADSEQEHNDTVRLISRTLAAMGYPKLVHEFGQAAEQVEVIQGPVHLKDVPSVRPVVRLRVGYPYYWSYTHCTDCISSASQGSGD
jgi:hypothetical protein